MQRQRTFGLKALGGFFGAVAGRIAKDERQAELERLHGLAFDLFIDLRMASAGGKHVPCAERIAAWILAENLRRSKEPPPPNGFAARVADVSDQEGSKLLEKP